MAHLWAKWLRHPCRLRDPHRFRAGGEIRSVPLVGKVATSPLPSRGSPPLQSAGGKSEVAHLWAKWLRQPCRLRDPHRFRAGGGIRSVPLVGKVATSPLPSRGSPPLQSGGRENQKWPSCGQSGYVTPAVSGFPTASERGGKSEVAHLWAKWLRHPCRLRDPHRFRVGGEIRSGPLVCKVATSALPSPGSPPLQSRGGNQKCPTCGQSGYITPAVSGIPTASGWGEGKSEVAHLWAKWLRHPCRLRDPHRFRAGGGIRSVPLVGKVAMSPLPSRGSPPLQSGGRENQNWPSCGQSGYVTPAVSGIHTASERGGKSEVAHLWAKWLRHPCRLRDPHRFRAGGGNQKWPTCGQSGYVTPAVSGIPTASEQGGKSEVSHLWAKWLRHPCCLGDPHRFRVGGGKIRSGPVVGKVATSPLPSRGSPPLQSGGENQKWPTCGQNGYVTPAVSGIPTAARRGGGGGSGPLVGKVAMSPLPSRGSPPLQSGGQNQKWPTCGQSGYVSPAVSGIPTAAERGGNQKWPTCGQSGYVTPAVSGIPTASERGGNQKWPTCGQSSYVTPAVSGIPTASERGEGKAEVAQLWAKWLRQPCCIGDPDRCRAGGESKVAHLWAKWLRHPCRLGDPHGFRAGGKLEVAHLWAKWLRHPCRLGDPHRCRVGGGKSEVAHLWAKWLHHPCRLGDPHRFRVGGGKIRSGPVVGKVATSPLPSRGSPPLQSRGGNQKCPTCGQSGYITPAVSGIPTASERGGRGHQKWPTCGTSGYVSPAVSGIPTAAERGGGDEKWPTCGQSGYVTPAVSGIPTAAKRGGEIRSGPLVGKVATSPLPSQGSPPL